MKAPGLVSFAASLALVTCGYHAAAYDNSLVPEVRVEARAVSGVPSTGPGVLSFLKQHLGDARSFCSSYTPRHPTVTTTKLATRTSTVKSPSTTVHTITRTVTAARETTTTTRTKVSLRTELDQSVSESSSNWHSPRASATCDSNQDKPSSRRRLSSQEPFRAPSRSLRSPIKPPFEEARTVLLPLSPSPSKPHRGGTRHLSEAQPPSSKSRHPDSSPPPAHLFSLVLLQPSLTPSAR